MTQRRILILVGYFVGLALVGQANASLPVVAQETTPTPNAELATLRAELEEMRRSQEQTLSSVSTITTAASAVGTILVVVAVALVGANIWQANKSYDRDREHLQKTLTAQASESLEVARAELAAEYSERLDSAIASVRPALDKAIKERMETLRKQNAETLNRWRGETESVVENVADAAWRAQANDARILMLLAGLPAPDLKEHELRPRMQDALAAILELIDVAAQSRSSTRATHVSMAFYYLQSYLENGSVAVNQAERHQIEERLKRHRGDLHRRAERIEELTRERFLIQDEP